MAPPAVLREVWQCAWCLGFPIVFPGVFRLKWISDQKPLQQAEMAELKKTKDDLTESAGCLAEQYEELSEKNEQTTSRLLSPLIALALVLNELPEKLTVPAGFSYAFIACSIFSISCVPLI